MSEKQSFKDNFVQGAPMYIIAIILLIAFIIFSVQDCKGQTPTLELGGRSFNIMNISAPIQVTIVNPEADTANRFYNVRIITREARRLDGLDSTVYNVDTTYLPYISNAELASTPTNTIANTQAQLAQAEVMLANESAVNTALVRLNPLIVQATGKGYLTTMRDNNLSQFVGYYRLVYNGNTTFLYIRPDATVRQVQAGANNTVVPTPSGYSGTVDVLNGQRRLRFNNIVAGDTDIRVSSTVNNPNVFYRTFRNVRLERLADTFQQREYVE